MHACPCIAIGMAHLLHVCIYPLKCVYLHNTFKFLLKAKCLRSFVPSFVRLFVPSFLRSFVPSFLRSFVRSFVPSFAPSFVPSFFRSFVHRSFLRSFVRSFVHRCCCRRRCAWVVGCGLWVAAVRHCHFGTAHEGRSRNRRRCRRCCRRMHDHPFFRAVCHPSVFAPRVAELLRRGKGRNLRQKKKNCCVLIAAGAAVARLALAV